MKVCKAFEKSGEVQPCRLRPDVSLYHKLNLAARHSEVVGSESESMIVETVK